MTEESNNVLAREGKNNRFPGSPYYMSPEQCLSTAIIDSRSDIYSLAIVLYETLSARLPYGEKSALAVIESHVNEEPLAFNLSQPGLKVCTELARVLQKAMAKDPENRYQLIEEFGVEMQEALERDAIKLKAIRHRSVAARQTVVNAQAIAGEELLLTQDNGHNSAENNLLELQLQTGRQFLSQQAEIEANFLPVRKAVEEMPIEEETAAVSDLHSDGIVFGLMGRIKAIFIGKKRESVKLDLVSEHSKQQILLDPREKHCFYCGASVPAGIQFCLNCQRNLPNQAHTLSETYSGAGLSRSRFNDANGSRMTAARSSIKMLRQSGLSTTFARARRTINYAITLLIIFTCLVFCQRFGDVFRPVRYLVQWVDQSTGLGSANFGFTKKKH